EPQQREKQCPVARSAAPAHVSKSARRGAPRILTKSTKPTPFYTDRRRPGPPAKGATRELWDHGKSKKGSTRVLPFFIHRSTYLVESFDFISACAVSPLSDSANFFPPKRI